MNAHALSVRKATLLNTWPLQVGLGLAALLAWVQWAAAGLVGVDGYYHLKMAALMRGDLTPSFPWLPLTILNPADYVDHHWLFHVLLLPFAGGDLVAGGKLATVLFGAAALTMAAWLLRAQRVPGAFWWAVGLFAASSAFLYRLSMPRAQSLSLLWLLLAAHLLLQRRERWLLVLGVTYVWLYDAFPLLLVVAGIYVLAARLLEGEWRPGALLYPAVGLALGLLLHPYFPHNLAFIAHHLVAKLDPTGVPVGNEWYPYSTAQLLENSGTALLAFAAGVGALGWSRRRLSLPTALMLGLSLVFGALLLQSRRFVEYFPAFAVLFCAFAWQPVLQGRRLPRSLRALAAVALLTLAAWTGQRARSDLAAEPPPTQLAGAAHWLAANTPPGTLVFQSDWDDFPRLFFHNSRNVYTVGLDPTYLQRADRARYLLWVDLSQGRGLDVSAAIREQFGADFAVSDLRHEAFLQRADDDPQMIELYRDAESVIFAILD